MNLHNTSLFRQQCYINGNWVEAENSQKINVTNPANGEIIGTVPKMGVSETRKAVVAAEKAQKNWAAKTAKERAYILRKWHNLMLENMEDLALILTLEQGKPLAEARGEITYAASYLEWFAEEAKRIYGDVIPGVTTLQRVIVIKQPIGVTAAITPWNFPSAMITRKAGAAIAAGCSMVLKPATSTPFSALALAALSEEAGVPAGILNVLTGSSSEIGKEITENPIVRKLSFTGSTEIGAKLIEKCAPTVKKLSMELGGNAPFIVFEDANIDKAVKGTMDSKFRNAGQTCVCANRIYVQQNVYDEFVKKLVQAVKQLHVGNGTDEKVSIGPLIDSNAVEKVKAHIADAVSKGAKIIEGGHALGGNFFEPTILVDVPIEAKVSKEETFGPLAPIFKFETEDEVIRYANDTEFGLASYFFTDNSERIFSVSEALEYGIVGINTGLISSEMAPFGGIKASGMGREGSKYGIEDYLEIKYLCLNLKK
ncbi:Succinate-semialdehyde dehydrogenase [NADP(+)] GabD [Commensalibacter sp. Nvir]|uniref:NADP-dependent succinate-semialdehyde dehydrogenase n=1 Tax=Commensalibacter sp. Nvir TaxID=3069817 RepID=UPI002D655947|nr:Succinate-semialdehyde dehydrogenase [NADP(+)] GabD [Commensalibacter sp. Nvir]